MKNEYLAGFDGLTFDDFRRRAQDSSLSKYEKIGFPDSYRSEKERQIFADIEDKLPQLRRTRQTVLDIGPGCSELPLMLVERCRQNEHSLVLVDSPEMLSHLPDDRFIAKIPGRFPVNCRQTIEESAGRVDAILAYSVFHYVFAEANPFEFLDGALGLLAPGGALLIGDIPNESKRSRFFDSAAGVAFHQSFTGSSEAPHVRFNRSVPGKIDDAVIVSLLLRCRAAGFDAYVVPQRDDLPMANRREDLLIVRP